MQFRSPRALTAAGWPAQAALGGLAVAAAAAAVDALLIEPRRVVASYHTVALRGLPASFEGLTVAQLTDLHVGARHWRPAVLARAVRLVNLLRPDLVVLTGDFADSSIGPVVCARYLSALCAPCGVVAVLGNHDYYGSPRRPGLVVRALQSAGVQVLCNSSYALERGGERLWLAGVDDGRLRRADVAQALRAIPAGAGPRILLSHYPDLARTLSPGQVDLVLAGHTHGGQINLPVLARVACRRNARSRYVAGFYDVRGTPLFISRGIASIGVPARFRCLPEVPLLRLVAAPG
jgi:predicted MPP superfamily phosphohydrolase